VVKSMSYHVVIMRHAQPSYKPDVAEHRTPGSKRGSHMYIYLLIWEGRTTRTGPAGPETVLTSGDTFPEEEVDRVDVLDNNNARLQNAPPHSMT